MKIYLLTLLSSLFFFSCGGLENVQVFLATEDIQQGTNRFSVALADKNGLVNKDTIEVFFEGEGGYPKFSKILTFTEFPDYYDSGLKRGIYSEIIEFNKAGNWILKIGDSEIIFVVKKLSNSLNVGDIAPKSENLTLDDASLENLSTGTDPFEPFYINKISDLINDRSFFVVSFLSPAFCTSPTCGPQMETLKEIHKEIGTRNKIVHIETYINPKEVKENFENKIINPVIQEWGLDENQWLYVISDNGIIIAKFEGFASADNIKEYLPNY